MRHDVFFSPTSGLGQKNKTKVYCIVHKVSEHDMIKLLETKVYVSLKVSIESEFGEKSIGREYRQIFDELWQMLFKRIIP